jgi:transcriptional regulator with XRE-family HTH domain
VLDAAARRRAVIRRLAARRALLGLSQTVVAARMSTSQPVVARLESGDLDSRLSTIERYAAAVGLEVDLVVREPVTAVGTPMVARPKDPRYQSGRGRLRLIERPARPTRCPTGSISLRVNNRAAPGPPGPPQASG